MTVRRHPLLSCPGRASRALLRFAADATGGVAAIVAITAPVIVGAMGLGSEAGYWYLTSRRVQNAADVAAHGAGRQLGAGGDAADMQRAAEYLAGHAEIDLAAATVQVRRPPREGSYAGNDSAVEVEIVQTVPRLFSAMYTTEPLSIGGRAVAMARAGGTGCVLALSRTAQGAITVSGSAEATLTRCDMVSNASGTGFMMSGNGSSVSANCVQTAGTAVTTGNLAVACDSVREHAAPVADPFGDVDEPALTGACQPARVGQNNRVTTVAPIESHASGMMSRRFCNGLELRGTVALLPGLYLVEGGDFRINSNAVIRGDGVAFYLADGVELHFNGGADLDLSAPATGPYAGILIFGSRDSTGVSHTINGNAGSSLDGAIYAPASHLTVSGSAGTSPGSCTQFVTDTITLTGNAEINISCETPFGPNIDLPGGVALVE